MKKLIITAIATFIVAGIIFVLGYRLLNETTNVSKTTFSISEGETLKDISDKLKDKNIIGSSEYMIIYTKLKGLETKIQAGEYTIAPDTTMEELLIKLQNPNNEYVKVTIPEGYTIYQIAKRLEEHGLVDRKTFINRGLDIFKDKLGIEERKDVLYPLEGFLFPDTYYFSDDMDEEEIIETMYKGFNRVFGNKYIKRAKELNHSINEIITIASLIEKEAFNDDERSKIAGVIYNRINKGMPLQIDASVIYAITKGEKSINRLLYKDLKVESKYNTYMYTKLPPGPIASPGKASIEAALYSEEHDYLYYVLGENGHTFSKSYEEHLRNIEKIKAK